MHHSSLITSFTMHHSPHPAGGVELGLPAWLCHHAACLPGVSQEGLDGRDPQQQQGTSEEHMPELLYPRTRQYQHTPQHQHTP